VRKKGGERVREVCNRASDARCAAVPNLGTIGGARRNILPQLCGRSRGRVLCGARSTRLLTAQGRCRSRHPLTSTGRRPSRMSDTSDLWSADRFSRASSASLSPSSGQQPGRLAAQSARAVAEAPRECPPDGEEEGSWPAHQHRLPRREVEGGPMDVGAAFRLPASRRAKPANVLLCYDLQASFRAPRVPRNAESGLLVPRTQPSRC
jgi:hypothetical protein